MREGREPKPKTAEGVKVAIRTDIDTFDRRCFPGLVALSEKWAGLSENERRQEAEQVLRIVKQTLASHSDFITSDHFNRPPFSFNDALPAENKNDIVSAETAVIAFLQTLKQLLAEHAPGAGVTYGVLEKLLPGFCTSWVRYKAGIELLFSGGAAAAKVAPEKKQKVVLDAAPEEKPTSTPDHRKITF